MPRQAHWPNHAIVLALGPMSDNPRIYSLWRWPLPTSWLRFCVWLTGAVYISTCVPSSITRLSG